MSQTYLLTGRSCWPVMMAKLLRTVLRLARTWKTERTSGELQEKELLNCHFIETLERNIKVKMFWRMLS